MKKIDFAKWKASLVTALRQFNGLDMRDPSSWPRWPQMVLLGFVALLVLTGLWFAWLSGYNDELTEAAAKEDQLRQQYTSKVTQAASLAALKKQREQVQQYVTLMEKQLPSKSEMDALLSDITTAGRGRGLQFEYFRPGQVELKEYYAMLPIAIKLTGKYHDLGAFTADIAHLSRIVTLNNMGITASNKEGTSLVMDATARTFRYLDPDEVAAQKKGKAAK